MIRKEGTRKRIKKYVVLTAAVAMVISVFAGCGNKASSSITVISREEGSGTRGAFTEIVGIDKDGVDQTTQSAEISQSTSVVMTTVEGNKNAIGYVSAGSLKDTVKALKVDGVLPTVEDIKSGAYPIARPFLLVTNDNLTELANDFIQYVLSTEGQGEVEGDGYVPSVSGSALKNYAPKNGLSGKIAVVGSTSVAPLLQKIADNYKAINSDVTIEIQQPGSGAGITSIAENACDIAMSSRELKTEERAKGLNSITIAMDGIAVIVNKENTVDQLTTEDIRKIFTGESTDWSAYEK